MIIFFRTSNKLVAVPASPVAGYRTHLPSAGMTGLILQTGSCLVLLFREFQQGTLRNPQDYRIHFELRCA